MANLKLELIPSKEHLGMHRTKKLKALTSDSKQVITDTFNDINSKKESKLQDKDLNDLKELEQLVALFNTEIAENKPSSQKTTNN